MEPVIEEEASKRSFQDDQQPSQSRKNTGHSTKAAPFTSSNRSKGVGKDFPSLKYKDIDEAVSRVVLAHAQAPPKPTLPRRSGLRTWNATTKERNPLAASLTGPGRAGKYAKLLGDAGGHFEGEVLAGRPHGTGRYMAAKGPGSSEHVLQYEGDWVQGRREGTGTRYFVNGEEYTGEFVANIRHGTGRYYFSNGDMYVGQWLDDRRTGYGTYFYASGDIFVGNFVRDKKEGLGTLYMMERQKKYVAEFVNGSPKCGTVLAIEDADLEPLRGQLLTLALHKKLDLAASGRTAPKMPELQLRQPNKVLGEQVVGVRRARAESKSAALRAVQENSGTLSDRDLEMLRHSFTLMAAGDDLSAGLLPHQLRELCVMAGLDPAASITRSLVDGLLARRDEISGRIKFDSFLKVAVHFRDVEVEDMLEVEDYPAVDDEDQQAEVVEDDEELVEPGGHVDAAQQGDYPQEVDDGVMPCEAVTDGASQHHSRPVSVQADRLLSAQLARPSSQQGSRPPSARVDQSLSAQDYLPPSQHGSRPATAQADQPPSQQGSRPATAQADQPPSQHGSRPATAQADQPPSQQGSRPTSAQVERPPSQPSSRPVSAQVERPASARGDRPPSAQGQPGSKQSSRPTSAQAEHLQNDQAEDPATQQLSRQASVQYERAPGQQPSRQASVQSERAPGQQPSRQASVQAERAPDQQPSRQASVQAERAPGQQPSRQASVQAERSASKLGSRPASAICPTSQAEPSHSQVEKQAPIPAAATPDGDAGVEDASVPVAGEQESLMETQEDVVEQQQEADEEVNEDSPADNQVGDTEAQQAEGRLVLDESLLTDSPVAQQPDGGLTPEVELDGDETQPKQGELAPAERKEAAATAE